MKKILSTFLAAVMAVSVAIPTMAADTSVPESPATAAETVPFSDVKLDTPQGEAILKMYENGCLAGYEDGTFRPDGFVTRAELVRIINQVFNFTVNEKLATTDFSDKSAWFYQDVRTAQQMGYISGFGDNTFRPKDNFTRQQACVVLTLLTNAKDAEKEVVISDTVAPWAKSYVDAAINAGLFTLEENNTFRATQNITRGELCLALADFVKEDTQATTSAESTSEATTETETTTKKTTTGGGGGSSSSSSDKKDDTTTTTEATTNAVTTEATTETTTKDSSTTPVKPTTTTTTTEATTEVTTAEVQVDEALLTSINRTIRNLNRYVIPNCTSDAQKEVAQDIADAMTAYKNDYSYDVESAANEAMDKYRALESTEKEELKSLIVGYCAMSDLVKLRDTFFPGLTVA